MPPRKRKPGLQKYELPAAEVPEVDPEDHFKPVEGAMERISDTNPIAIHDRSKVGALRLTEKGLEVVRNMASRCRSYGSIARCLGVSNSKFASMRREDPRIQEFFDAGISVAEDLHTDRMLRMAETQVVAGIFMGKVKFGWRDDGSSVEQKSNVTIHMYGAMSPEQYAEMLAKGASPLQLPQSADADKQIDEEQTVYISNIPKPLDVGDKDE